MQDSGSPVQKAREHFLLALNYISKENWVAAEKELKKSLAQVPNRISTLTNLCATLIKIKKFQEAKDLIEKAASIYPDNPELFFNQGLLFFEEKHYREALESFQRSIELKSDYADAWINRGLALNALNRHEDALVSYDKSIELKPDFAEAWGSRGIVLSELKCYEDALASFDKAIELNPGYAEAWNNRGITLSEIKRHDDALASYDKALELKPDYAEAFYNKSILQLVRREFLSGFQNYLWRWEAKKFPSVPIKTTLPRANRNLWKGNVLIWAEQGLGDEIFYAGMLSQACQKFSSVTLLADKRLHSILRRSFPELTVIDREQAKFVDFDNEFESQLPIGDLGHLLALNEQQIKVSRGPFLVPESKKTEEFRSSLSFSHKKVICGIAWSSANKRFGKEKSIDLNQLEHILRNPRLEFVNLQYGDIDLDLQDVKKNFHVKIHEMKNIDIFNDIDSLLSLIDACDIVITTSNVTAHLAGSIGKRGCVLVPYSRGRLWYWHQSDVFSFWYPSLKIFYQNDRSDWSDAVRQATRWIEEIF